jgi:hypothetical protein
MVTVGSIRSAEVRQVGRNTKRGPLWGGAIGAVAGIVTWAAQTGNDECRDSGAGFCDVLDPLVNRIGVEFVFLSTALGAGLGALIGTAIKTERWLPGLVFSPALDLAGAFGFSLSTRVPILGSDPGRP